MAEVDNLMKPVYPTYSIDGNRESLEVLVSPLVTTKKTPTSILFKGKRRYLTLTVADRHKRIFFAYAVKALQFLYQFERAAKKGDVEDMFQSAQGFGVYFHHCVIGLGLGEDITAAIESTQRRRSGSAKGGKATTKWTPKVEQLARDIFAEVKRGKVKDTPARRRTAARLKAKHGINISPDTIKRHLRKSAQR